MKNIHRIGLLGIFCGTCAISGTPARALSLSLGADYMLRNVSVTERDKTLSGNNYYDSRLIGYLITTLTQDVEATIRVQSITPWGLEGSTTPLHTRYPDANGGLWVQNAFIRLPGFLGGAATLTLGRQPLRWGEGTILSDDDLGLNALRLQARSPYRLFPADVDLFTARVNEGLRVDATDPAPGATDLHGLLLGFDRPKARWEVMGLIEKGDQDQNYAVGSSSIPAVASGVNRRIMGVRARTRLRDAYMKAEYYRQDGDVSFRDEPNIKLGGEAYLIGLGAHTETRAIGRVAVSAEFAEGSGDKAGTTGTDEAFRAPFAARWSGLERVGYGRYFAATLSDAYAPEAPFAPAGTTNTGLPPGVSGIRSAHFGVEATPWAKWSFLFDFTQFKALNNPLGERDLGVEFDYGVIYRHSGLVTFRAWLGQFKPGEAYPEDTRQKARWTSLSAEITF